MATFRDIIEGFYFELQNMIFTVGDIILWQKRGAGVGGRLSPLAARVTCIMKEHKWQKRIGRFLYGPLRAVRHMDDTPMIVHKNDVCILPLYQYGCYREEVTLEQDAVVGVRMVALGCQVSIQPGGGGYCCLLQQEY